MSERRFFPAGEMSERDSYRLLTGTIVPRPIAWVSSMSAAGTLNLAPFSFFTGASLVPPMVVFAVEPRRGLKKDTLRNVEDTGEFVLNTVVEGLPGAVTVSAQDFPEEESEFEHAGLTPLPSRCVKPPGVAESPVNMECRLHQVVRVGSGPHSLVIGEIVAVQADPRIFEPSGRVSFEALRPVGRMAGDVYVRCNDFITETRKDWRGEDY
jgi:flavin reductase (DIM6/NTAB) family NADH-FMN oxidoreductase RutF